MAERLEDDDDEIFVDGMLQRGWKHGMAEDEDGVIALLSKMKYPILIVFKELEE